MLSLYFINEGIEDHRKKMASISDFQESEAIMFSRLLNYTHYSFYGVKFLFVPAASGIFFQNPGFMSELSAGIDSIATLCIYNNCKGKSLFLNDSTSLFRFADVVLILGSLFFLLWGYETLGKREYLKFLTGILNYRKIFSYLLISRIIILIIAVLVLFAAQLIMVKVNGVEISSQDLSGFFFYFILTVIIMILFFILGVIAGNFKRKYTKMASIIAIWFILVLLLPGIINHIILEKAGKIIPDSKVRFEKLLIIDDFENRSADKYGMFDRKEIETGRAVVAGFLKKDQKQVQALEARLKREIEDNINRYRILAKWTPATFYQLTGSEVSSRGYTNFLEFYSYLRQMKRKFVQFYIDRVYYNDHRKLVSFIKGDENVFMARSRLPVNFVTGMGIHLFYLFLLVIIAYFRFRHYMFGIPDRKMPALKELAPEINRKKVLFILTDDDVMKNQFFNVANGRTAGFEGKVLVDGENIAAKGRKNQPDFTYLCRPGEIPGDIKVNAFVQLIQRIQKVSRKGRASFYVEADLEKIESKKFDDLNLKERARILFAAARLKQSEMVIIHDYARGMTVDLLLELRSGLNSMKESGCAVVYITTDYLLAGKIADQTLYLKEDPFVANIIHKSGFLD